MWLYPKLLKKSRKSRLLLRPNVTRSSLHLLPRKRKSRLKHLQMTAKKDAVETLPKESPQLPTAK